MDTLILLGIACAASLAAGAVNAVAGGGTLISFPVLIGLGLSPVSANITNTLALTPGYISGVFAQRKDIRGLKERLIRIIPISVFGGIAGGLILIWAGDRSLEILIPYLILGASLLLLVQVRLKRWLQTRAGSGSSGIVWKAFGLILLFLAAVYGGYFGAGVSILVLAVLGMIYDESLTSLNALKQMISFCINISASLYFIFTGRVEWIFVLVMGAGSIAGGFAGGMLVERINPDILRYGIVCAGILIALVFFVT